MANGTFTAPSGTQSAPFNVPLAFGAAVTGVDKTDIDLRPITPNATDGVDFSISGTGTAWSLAFTLSSERSGQFEISFTGLVTPVGGSSPEGVMANTIIVSYNTITAQVEVGFGELQYREPGLVALPVKFSENYIVLSKTVFSLTHISGDTLTDIEYYVVGENANYELIFLIEPDAIGAFMVSFTGELLKADGTYEVPTAITPKLVPYNSYIPYVVNSNFGEELTTGIWDIFMELNRPAVGVGVDGFILEGVDPGTPVLYRACSLDIEPDRPEVPVDPTVPSEQIGDWVLDETGNSQVPARYFILRFNVPPNLSGQTLSITPKLDAFRSPLYL